MSFADAFKSSNAKSKVLVSYLEVKNKYQITAVVLRGFKAKTEVRLSYLEVKNKKPSDEEGTYRLNCNK